MPTSSALIKRDHKPRTRTAFLALLLGRSGSGRGGLFTAIKFIGSVLSVSRIHRHTEPPRLPGGFPSPARLQRAAERGPFLSAWFAGKKSPPNSVALMFAAAVLGVLSFGLMLASRHIADGDLWAKLSLGAHVWKFGSLPHHDVFAFTQVLPEYVDHEWGAGAIFYGLLKFFGPTSLMWLKTVLAFGT